MGKIDKKIEAVINVLKKKKIITDSLTITETPFCEYNHDLVWKRTISMTFTEIICKEDLENAKQNGGLIQPVFRQVMEEYNRLTMYDMDIKETKDGVEVKTNWLE